MEILNDKSSLGSLLSEYQGRDISIVTAFASGMEEYIDLLIENNRSVSIVVGTINSFSSPGFIYHCSKRKIKKFSFSVDFRREESTHWKLYLISPDVVIIGSANFTKLGLSLVRDTCVKIDDEQLYRKYLKEILKMKNNSRIVSSSDKQFRELLDEYTRTHREQQRNRGRTKSSQSAMKWLECEENQTFPLLIWHDNHTMETKKKAVELLKQEIGDVEKNDIRDFFTLEDDLESLPYSQGDVVLTSKDNGRYLAWHTLDVILCSKGVCYMYSLKKHDKGYYRPFSLGQIKKALQERMIDWREADVTELKRTDLEDILHKSLTIA